MWWWVRIGAQYSKGLECCSGRSICFSSRNNCPGIWICFVVGWWFFFFGLVVRCQLLAGHWGKVQGVCSPRQVPVPYWTWRQARAGCLRPLSCLPLGLALSDGLLHCLGCFSEALGWALLLCPASKAVGQAGPQPSAPSGSVLQQALACLYSSSS